MIGITGHKGYIGSRICENLSQQGRDYIGIDKQNGDDILDEDVVQDRFSNAGSVVHLAAISGISDCESNPTEAIRTNIRGTIHIANYCQNQGKRLIFASSFASDRENVYGKSKKTAEDAIESICDDYLIFKMSNVYGGDKDTVVNIFVDRWNQGLPLEIHNPGNQVRDFIYIDDISDAYISAVDSNYTGSLELVSGEVVSIEELANMISDETVRVDSGQENEIFELDTDASGLENIDFSPSISLEEGIEIEKYER